MTMRRTLRRVVWAHLAGLTGVVTLAGAAPAATVTPSSLAFASQAVGTESTPSFVMMYASEPNPARGVVTSSATATGDFRVGSVGCARTSCTIAVYFRPTTVGPASGVLTVLDNFDVPHLVALSGIGGAGVSTPAAGMGGVVGLAAVGMLGFGSAQAVSRRQKRRKA